MQLKSWNLIQEKKLEILINHARDPTEWTGPKLCGEEKKCVSGLPSIVNVEWKKMKNMKHVRMEAKKKEFKNDQMRRDEKCADVQEKNGFMFGSVNSI